MRLYRIKNPYSQSIGIANPDEPTTTTKQDEPTTTTNQDEPTTTTNQDEPTTTTNKMNEGTICSDGYSVREDL